MSVADHPTLLRELPIGSLPSERRLVEHGILEADTPNALRPGAFPRMYLSTGERLVYETKPSLFAFVNPVASAGVLLTALAFAVILRTFSGAPGITNAEVATLVAFWILFSLVVISTFMAINFLRWRATSFAITDRRVIRSIGIVGRHTVDCSHDKIQSVTLSQGWWGRAFGFGTIAYHTAWRPGKIHFSRRRSEQVRDVFWFGLKDPIRTRRFVEEIRQRTREAAESHLCHICRDRILLPACSWSV